jgi:hypothetical protein
MLSMLAADNSGSGVQSILPFIANHYIGTAVQTYLDENGDQAVVNYGIYASTRMEPTLSRSVPMTAPPTKW